MTALLQLVLAQTGGRARRLAHRLRRPWVLLPGLVGTAFAIYSLALVLAAISWASPVGLSGVIGTLLLWSVGGAWMAAVARPHPGLSAAEVQLLIPAPLTRRQLLLYRVLRAQPGLLIAAGVVALAAGDARMPHLTAGLGTWIVFNALLLHQLAAAMTLAWLRSLGLPRWLTVLPAALVVALLAIVLLISMPPSPGLEASFGELLSWSDAVWHVSPAREILSPLRLLAELPLASDTPLFLHRLPPVLAILALLAAWVWGLNADFTEAAAGALDDRNSEPDDGVSWLPRAWPVPMLAPSGPAWLALTWRGLAGLARRIEPSAVLSVLGIQAAVGLGWWVSRGIQPDQELAQSISGLAIGVVVIGPSLLTADLRQDRDRLVVMRAWPVPGRAILRGAVLPPTLLLAAVQLLIILGGLLASDADLPRRLAIAGGAALALPGATFLAVALANLMMVLWPALEERGPGARGVESIGRLLLSTVLRNLSLWVLLIPAWIGFALALYASSQAELGATSMALAGWAFGLIVIVESELVVGLAGRALDRAEIHR